MRKESALTQPKEGSSSTFHRLGLLIGRCCNPLGAGAFLAELKSEIIQIQKDFLNKQEKNRPRVPRGPRLNAQERWNGKGAATKRAANGKVGERRESALKQPKRVVRTSSSTFHRLGLLIGRCCNPARCGGYLRLLGRRTPAELIQNSNHSGNLSFLEKPHSRLDRCAI